MKKFLIISAVLFCMLNGCEKPSSDLDSITGLQNELNLLTKSAVSPLIDNSSCNISNPYDQWGEMLYLGIRKALSENAKRILTVADFKSRLLEVMPKEYSVIDTVGVNMKKINILYKEFLSLYVNRNIFEALQISKKMEKSVSQSNNISNLDKSCLLKMVSILRYTSYVCFSGGSKSVDGSFEKCWKRKLQEMENSGFFERLACALDWPICFGAMLADCGIEELKEHVLN